MGKIIFYVIVWLIFWGIAGTLFQISDPTTAALVATGFTLLAMAILR